MTTWRAGKHVPIGVERLAVDVGRSPDGFVWDRLRLQFGEHPEETTDTLGVTSLGHAAFGDRRRVRTKPLSWIMLRCCSWKARLDKQVEFRAITVWVGREDLSGGETVEPSHFIPGAKLLATVHGTKQHSGRPTGERIGRPV